MESFTMWNNMDPCRDNKTVLTESDLLVDLSSMSSSLCLGFTDDKNIINTCRHMQVHCCVLSGRILWISFAAVCKQHANYFQEHANTHG